MSRECGETVCYEGCSLPQVATPLVLLNPLVVAVVDVFVVATAVVVGQKD